MLFVIGLIDSASNRRLEDVRNTTASIGIPMCSLYGHITFATYLGNDDTAFIASCKNMLRNYKPYMIHFERIDRLPNTPILAAFPIKEKESAAIHKRIVEKWKDTLTIWTQEEIWQPHTTLLNDAEADLNAALYAMQDAFTPFDAEIARIEFSRVQENGFEIVDAVDLV